MPRSHVDIGSSIGLIAVIGAYVPTVFVDYRPLKVSIEGLFPVAGDSLALPFTDNQLASLSCLHVIEHIGLGRYGDPLNARGTHLAAMELARVLAPGGKLYLSTPVGYERTQFNAQRIFNASSILAMFEGLRLEKFSLVDDAGHLIQPADVALGETCQYGCGLFEMTK
jgi:SAM-dependent methyltransferase